MTLRKGWSPVLVAVTAVFIFVQANQAQKRSRNRLSGPPTASLSAEPDVLHVCEGEAGTVRLFSNATSSSGNDLHFKWTANGGRISGSGANTTWDLTGAAPGVYQANVDVDEGDANCASFSSVAVVVTGCPPQPAAPLSCPTVTISCPDSARETAPVSFTANVHGGTGNITPTYNWTITAGRIVSGQGTTSITVDTVGLAGQTIRATLDVGGYGMPCPASCSVSLPIEVKAKKFDEYCEIGRNDERARLDHYANQLQSEPGTRGYIIIYPSKKAKSNKVQAVAARISDYLVNSRGIDASRFTITTGGARDGWRVELWIVPQGAPAPVPQQ